jgi:hypothetical protein
MAMSASTLARRVSPDSGSPQAASVPCFAINAVSCSTRKARSRWRRSRSTGNPSTSRGRRASPWKRLCPGLAIAPTAASLPDAGQAFLTGRLSSGHKEGMQTAERLRPACPVPASRERLPRCLPQEPKAGAVFG